MKIDFTLKGINTLRERFWTNFTQKIEYLFHFKKKQKHDKYFFLQSEIVEITNYCPVFIEKIEFLLL